MNLTKIDLNLFNIFDVIYTERNLTKAGQILGITQPAVSNALARLREAFDDVLFTRTAQGMMPTPVAQHVIPSVRQALHLLRSSVQEGHNFDPSTSTKQFNFSIPDTMESFLLPLMIPYLKQNASGVTLRTYHHTVEEFVNDLTTGLLDLVVDSAQSVPQYIRHIKVAEDDYVCVANTNHSFIKSKLSLEQYASAQHISICSRDSGIAFLDTELARLGITRNIGLHSHTHFSMPPIVRNTDYIATVPRTLAVTVQQHIPVQVLELPIEVPPVQSYLYWHENLENDPANKWMRELTISLLKSGSTPSELTEIRQGSLEAEV